MGGMNDHISTDPSILHGEPHFRGTRIPVTVVLDNLREGKSPEEILAHYPTLTEEHIVTAVAYAAAAGDIDLPMFPGAFQQLLERAREAAADSGLTRQDIEQAVKHVRETGQEKEAEEWDPTPEQRIELSKRLAEYLEDPGSAIPWEEVREQLTRRWDAADHLGTAEECAAYLSAVIEERDPELLLSALEDVMRATRLCERYDVEKLWLFGSALEKGREEAPGDLDLLVRLQPMDAYERVDAYFGLAGELERLLPLPHDLVMEEAVGNPYRKANIQQARRLVYEASEKAT